MRMSMTRLPLMPIVSSLAHDAGAEYATIVADVPLDNMFGYSNDLRGTTQGKVVARKS